MQHNFFSSDAKDLRKQLKNEEAKYMAAILEKPRTQDVSKIKDRMIALQGQLNRALKDEYKGL